MGKEKAQSTLIFYLKQNKEVQLDLQHFEIFIFLSLLPSLPPGKMLEEKLTYQFFRFGICMRIFECICFLFPIFSHVFLYVFCLYTVDFKKIY